MNDTLTSLAVVMILIACVGALLGGNSFGDSLRKGCGCGIWGVVAILALVLLLALMLIG